MIYLGIDPGNSGALAAIIEQCGEERRLEFYDTPIVTMKVGKKMKNEMDPAACALMLRRLQAIDFDVRVVIEKVQAMPGDGARSMGATSAFNFGKGFGMWIGLCVGLQLPYEMVHPMTWKKLMMNGMSKEKDASRVRAMQMFPQSAQSLQRKKDHGRADALLLAEYGRMARQ
ncbi:MAG TPA: hypothetical protein VK638_59065 [Edaphobacter sp.]|nr:hypothetical protein [Edaphobacter sp.]